MGVLRVKTADNENAIFIAKAMCEVKMRKCSAYIAVLYSMVGTFLPYKQILPYHHPYTRAALGYFYSRERWCKEESAVWGAAKR